MAGEPTWPTFPGVQGKPIVEPIGGITKVFRALSGRKHVVSVGDEVVLNRYTFRYNGLRTDILAPAPYNVAGAWGGAGLSEAECVRYLLGLVKGAAGLIYVQDPFDGLLRLCRFAGDSIPLEPVPYADWMYRAEISFEED